MASDFPRPSRRSLSKAVYPDQFRDHVEELRRLASLPGADNEGLHGYELDIHERALTVISKDIRPEYGAGQEIAKEALRTKRIKFDRWLG